MTFWEQFLPNLLATLVGAFVGFVLALRFDHARERRSRMGQEASLLRAARDAAEHNLQLIAQLESILAANKLIPSFEMDTVILDALLPQLVQLSSDTDLLARLNDFRYQLHHINRKLDDLPRLNQIIMGSPAQGVLVTAGNLEKSGRETLVPSINARIGSLEALQRRKRWMFR